MRFNNKAAALYSSSNSWYEPAGHLFEGSWDKRQIQSGAVCTSDFSWATNSKTQSPCLVAAYVAAACSTGSDWIIDALQPGNKYNTPQPSQNTSNPCTCSWSEYNLISACTDCQEFPDAVWSWSFYDSQCSGNLGSSYFPSNITLINGTAIPFWAAQDPSTWTNGIFNVTEAQALAAENKPDLFPGASTPSSSPSPSPTSTGSKTPVAAIAGGVAGGVTVIIVLALMSWFIYRHKTRNGSRTEGPNPRRPRHVRSHSDISQKSLVSSNLDQAALRSMSPMSANSGWLSMQHSSACMTTVSSTGGHVSSQMLPLPLENIVEPFLSERQTSHHSTPSSKSAPAATHRPDDMVTQDDHETIYDVSTIPARSEDAFGTLESVSHFHPARTRLNPPAYSETPPPSERQLHISLLPSPSPSPSPSPRPAAQKHQRIVPTSWHSGDISTSVGNTSNASLPSTTRAHHVTMSVDRMDHRSSTSGKL